MAHEPADAAAASISVGTFTAYGQSDNHIGPVYNNEAAGGKVRNVLLLRAIDEGQTSRVCHLLGFGANIDHQDERGLGVLHHAIEFGFDDMVENLRQRGADINMRDREGATPLCYAARAQRWHVAEMLISRRADTTLSGLTGTPLHWACRWGNIRLVNLLLEKGGNDVALFNVSLAKATELNLDHTHTWVKCPDDIPQLEGKPASDWRTALVLAAQFGHCDCVAALCKVAFEEVANDTRIISMQWEGQWALRYAICSGSVDCVRFLLQSGISPDSDDDPEGNRALLVAFQHQHWDVFGELLGNNARTNVVARDASSLLRLILTSDAERFESFFADRWQQLQLTKKFEWYDSGSQYYRSLLSIISKVRHHFKSARRSQNVDLLELQMIFGSATTEPPAQAVLKSTQAQAVLNTLVHLGGNVNVADHMGNTALSLATGIGDISAMTILLDASARADLGPENRLPLHQAVDRMHMEAVKLLLSKGAKADITRTDGWTPLHLAAKQGSVELIELLVGAGANVHAKTAGEHTPIQVAFNAQHLNAVDAFERLGAAPIDPMLLI